jgi:hypothetical protein
MSMLAQTKTPADETPLPRPTIPFSFGWTSGLESARRFPCSYRRPARFRSFANDPLHNAGADANLATCLEYTHATLAELVDALLYRRLS